jgi:uncharacterized cupredoxin-like copper-binding protein
VGLLLLVAVVLPAAALAAGTAASVADMAAVAALAEAMAAVAADTWVAVAMEAADTGKSRRFMKEGPSALADGPSFF